MIILNALYISSSCNSTWSAQTTCDEKYQSVPNALSEVTPSLSEIFKRKLGHHFFHEKIHLSISIIFKDEFHIKKKQFNKSSTSFLLENNAMLAVSKTNKTNSSTLVDNKKLAFLLSKLISINDIFRVLLLLAFQNEFHSYMHWCISILTLIRWLMRTCSYTEH